MSSSQPTPPKVFISYSHDSHEHLDRVLALADRLRAEGIDCNLDQYEPAPAEGWPRWMDKQFKDADFILVVCTETYCRRFEGREEKGKGLGVKWEGAIITDELYGNEAVNKRFIPVLFSADDAGHVPQRLQHFMRHLIAEQEGYEELYRRLTNQPRVVKPPLGKLRSFEPVNKLRSLPPEERQQHFAPIEEKPDKPDIVSSLPPPRIAKDEQREQPTIVQHVPEPSEVRKARVSKPFAQKLMLLSGNRWKWLVASGVLILVIWFGVTLSHNSPPSILTAMPSFIENLGNGEELVMVNLPGDEFTMGSNKHKDEMPPHQVKVGPFAIGKTEVTQGQWKLLMGDNPSNFKVDDNHPVEQVSWDRAQEFIKRLRDKTGDQTYRLPTEAEWEYAAHAGSTTEYCFGDDKSSLGEYAWYYDNSDSKTHSVGIKKPNAWSLRDMHGNVLEWCQDWYAENYYNQSPRENPQGPSSGTDRVVRGGSWGINHLYCRSASRNRYGPGSNYDFVGFRVVCAARTS
ncbi:MAG: SUMF1/EgtB/PvdO family nonheme iron enzyme [Blastocatellales bacterium]